MAKKAAPKRKPASGASSGNHGGIGFLYPSVTAVLVVLAVAGGYAWRSYAPLPFFSGSPLGSNQSNGDALISENEKEKLRELEDELRKIDEKRAEKEAELGESQIKAILSDS